MKLKMKKTLSFVMMFGVAFSAVNLQILKPTCVKAADKSSILNSTIQKQSQKLSDTIKEHENKEININVAVVGMYNEVLHEPKSIVLKGNTVEDILRENNIKYELNEDGSIKSINNVVNGTKTEDKWYTQNGKWLCSVNKNQVNGSIKEANITNGDSVVFYYSNDGRMPCYDNNFININVRFFDINAKKILDKKMLVLKGSNEYFIARNVFNEAKITDIKYYTETGSIVSCGYCTKVVINSDSKTVRNINTEVKDNDDVVIYQSGYDYSEAPYFSKIGVSSKEVNKGDTIDVTVLKVDENYDGDDEIEPYAYTKAGIVRVYFGDKSYVTDEEGKVKITCDTVGEFEIYADYDKTFDGEDNEHENFILITDKQKVVVKGEKDNDSSIECKSDKKELLKVIDEAKELYRVSEEGEKEGQYKKESKDKLIYEVNTSINISLDKTVTQEEVNKVVERLNSVIKDFKQSIVKINIEELNKVLEESLKINDSIQIGNGQGQYREEDKEKLVKEINVAKRLISNKNKTQKDVDEEVIKLRVEIENFKKSAIDIAKNFNVEVVDLQKEFVKGTSAEVIIKVTNNTHENKEVCFIIGVFNSNDKLIKYSAIKKVVRSGECDELTGSTKLPSEDGYKLKAFVWDSLEQMTPLSNVIEIPVK